MRGMPDLPFLLEEELLTLIRGTPAIVTGQLGGNARAVRQTRTKQELLVPSVGVQRIDSGEREIDGVVLIQFDFFHRSYNENRALRNAVLSVVHNDYHRTLGSLAIYSLYQGGRRHDDPTASSSHMSDDVEYHPYREYAT